MKINKIKSSSMTGDDTQTLSGVYGGIKQIIVTGTIDSSVDVSIVLTDATGISVLTETGISSDEIFSTGVLVRTTAGADSTDFYAPVQVIGDLNITTANGATTDAIYVEVYY